MALDSTIFVRGAFGGGFWSVKVMRPDSRVEDEWQAAIERIGTSGLVWAVVKLLLRKGVFTVEELCDVVQSEAGVRR